MFSVIYYHSLLVSHSLCSLLDLVHELRDGVKEVGLQPIVGDLEEGRLGVLVDDGDHLGVLHAGHVLDGARDTDGDVQLGGDDLAGLADLDVVRADLGLAGGARSTN